MNTDASKAASIIGAKGGKAGKGEKKVRGNADHYRKLAEIRWGKRKREG